jgi:HPt (histidine-containing phosphotransfer) domain-containing protein
VIESRFSSSLADEQQTLGPKAEHSCDDVIDVQGLYDRCMGNLDLMERVLKKFEQRLPDELDELERVLELKDPTMIAQVAHRIKGSTSNVSAGGLQRAAEEIEDLGRAGCVADKACLANLREEWRRFIDRRAAIRAPAAGSFGRGPTTGL